MTSEEWKRILIAVSQMHGYNINGKKYVPAGGVLRIIHSQLHPDDQAHWKFDEQTEVWSHVP